MRTLLLTLLATTPALALDYFDFADLRVGAAMTGSSHEVTTSGTTSGTAKEKWDQSTRVSADWVAGTDLILVGIAYGLGVVYDKRSSDALGYDTTIARVQAGPYVDIALLQLELLPTLGVGSAKVKAKASDQEDRTSSLEYGVNLNAVVAFSHLAVGATVGYLKTDSTATFDNGGSATDYEISGGDYLAGVFVGYRF